MSHHIVATLGEIAPGGRRLFTVAGCAVGVFHVDDEYFDPARSLSASAPPCAATCWSGLWNRAGLESTESLASESCVALGTDASFISELGSPGVSRPNCEGDLPCHG